MSLRSGCEECDRLFEGLEAATFRFFKAQSSLDIAGYSHDREAVERLRAELFEARCVRVELRRNLDAHRALLHVVPVGATPTPIQQTQIH